MNRTVTPEEARPIPASAWLHRSRNSVRFGQPGQGVVQRLVRELRVLALDRELNRAAQGLGLDVALVEVVLNAALHRLERQAAVLHACENDDRGVGREPVNRLHRVEALRAGQSEVEQDAAIDLAALQGTNSLVESRRVARLEAVAEHGVDQLRIARVVFHYQYAYGSLPWAHFASLRSEFPAAT